MVSSPARPLTRLEKSDVLAGLFTSWDDIARLLADLPDVRWTSPTPLPGWCVRDVVGHVIGTESMLLGSRHPTPTSTSRPSTTCAIRSA